MSATSDPGAAPVRRFLEVGEIRFSHCSAGAGPPLVLLHGIGSNAASWRDQLAGLGDFRRVVAWDAPGYGDSTPVAPARPMAADYAERLERFLDGLGLERVDLLGHSLGALIAGSFAAERPRRVERLILAAPALGHRTEPSTALPPAARTRLDDLDEFGPAGLAARRAPRLLSGGAGPEQLERAREAMAAIRPGGYRQAVAMLAQGDLRADADALAMPVLVLCGSEDAVTPPAASRALAAATRAARYREIPGAGHLSHLERPGAFNAAVREFLLP